jgi:glucose/arabinose dehydrogenase
MAARSYLLLALMLLAACGRTPPPTPSPPTTDPGETINGRERVGWDQPASDAAELATFRYAIYVDGVRSEVADVSCVTTPGSGGFACSGRLPPLTTGSHTLELAAFYDAGGIVESAKSPPLRVTVTAVTAPADAAPLRAGEVLTTLDRVALTAERLAGSLRDVVDVALLPDGGVLIAERAGAVRIVRGSGVSEALGAATARGDGAIGSVALDPDVARTGHVFVVHTPPGVFRLVRYRIAGDVLVDRAVLLRDVPASADPAAVLRFGPDGKLYAAFDDGGRGETAARLSEWPGKILRLNSDGGTPDDQPAASPVYWSGLRRPRGLGWRPQDGTLWIADDRGEGVERITALAAGATRPRRAAQRAAYPLPQPLGARALDFHRGGDVPALRGDMFIAASDAGYLLRIRFDPADPARVFTSERLLEGRLGVVRSVAMAADGSIYVASDSALWRLAPAR